MIRIGFDIGGSKLAAIALDEDGRERARTRRDVPRSYGATIEAVGAAVATFERAHGPAGAVGIALPGMIGADGTPIRVVNLPWLEGRLLRADLAQALGKAVAIANDANCFALSESIDGAAAGASVVFGAILGTGVGGGIVIGGKPLAGANATAGEWGHNPMPGLEVADGPPVACGCGRTGCIETWLNGAALARDYRSLTGRQSGGPEIARLAEDGESEAQMAMARYERRLARALAGIVNILDPDVIVLGGGLSSIASLYAEVPKLWAPLVVAPEPKTRLVPARFGPESGLRGAAWLGRLT
ncbi:MAG TPA: ROK family protein [Geminicoccaceae bacterium]|nr:ROK family protein [Geminicoccaceae bacterium]